MCSVKKENIGKKCCTYRARITYLFGFVGWENPLKCWPAHDPNGTSFKTVLMRHHNTVEVMLCAQEPIVIVLET